MANLEEMRDFQAHWHTYRDEQQHLDRLQANVPVNVGALVDDVFDTFLSDEPADVVYDLDVLRCAISTSDPQAQPRELTPVWGWWFDDEGWAAWHIIDELRATMEDESLKLRAIEAQRHAAVEDDETRRCALDSIAAYTKANDDDRRLLAELERRVSEMEASAQHLEGGLLKRLMRRISLWFALKREHERLERLRNEVGERTERRSKEMDRLTTQVTECEQELTEPFDAPHEECTQALEAAQQALLAAFTKDLTCRDDAFDADSLSDADYQDALVQVCRREWALLGAWMERYRRELPAAIEHARLVVDSELVWLEGHAAFGKRYWALTDAVVEAMEAGERDSKAALATLLNA